METAPNKGKRQLKMKTKQIPRPAFDPLYADAHCTPSLAWRWNNREAERIPLTIIAFYCWPAAAAATECCRLFCIIIIIFLLLHWKVLSYQVATHRFTPSPVTHGRCSVWHYCHALPPLNNRSRSDARHSEPDNPFHWHVTFDYSAAVAFVLHPFCSGLSRISQLVQLLSVTCMLWARWWPYG